MDTYKISSQNPSTYSTKKKKRNIKKIQFYNIVYCLMSSRPHRRLTSCLLGYDYVIHDYSTEHHLYSQQHWKKRHLHVCLRVHCYDMCVSIISAGLDMFHLLSRKHVPAQCEDATFYIID